MCLLICWVGQGFVSMVGGGGTYHQSTHCFYSICIYIIYIYTYTHTHVRVITNVHGQILGHAVLHLLQLRPLCPVGCVFVYMLVWCRVLGAPLLTLRVHRHQPNPHTHIYIHQHPRKPKTHRTSASCTGYAPASSGLARRYNGGGGGDKDDDDAAAEV